MNISYAETWRPVVGYENTYSVSNFGRVRRDATGRGARAGRILRHGINRHGYCFVNLYNSVSRNTLLVHRLVAFAFIGPCDREKQVNHLNGKKHDNRLENLEWATRSQNVRHSIDVLGALRARGERHGRAKLTKHQVLRIASLVSDGKTQHAIASSFGVSRSAIAAIAQRRNWRHI